MICAVCCATKRVTEIACPSDCVYLASARQHPAAVVRRQQERDVSALAPVIRALTERQYQLFFLFHTAVASHKSEGLTHLTDDDVVDAAAALAATLETAARGVIYDHPVHSLPGKRLLADLQQMLGRIREEGANVSDLEAASVLRAVEQGARETRKRTGGGGTSYLELMGRLLHVETTSRNDRGSQPAPGGPGSIILP